MPRSHTYHQVHDALQKAKRVLIVSHQNPDGDTSGSGLALAHYFDRLGTPHTCFCTDPLHPMLQFLPGAERYTADPAAIHANPHDLLVVVDCSDIEYAGVADHLQKLPALPTIVNIDHHATNTFYGTFNIVEPNRASTTEILTAMFDELRIPLSPEMATCLLTGVLTDTSTFSNPATNASVLAAASRLMVRGARVREIMHHILKNKSVPQLTLWGRALERLKEDPKTGFVSTIITQEDLDACGASAEDAEGIANFLGGVARTQAIMVLRELPDHRIKGSMRTTSELIDVANIAKLYGGGGHRKAAGFTVTGSVRETPTKWVIEPTRP